VLLLCFVFCYNNHEVLNFVPFVGLESVMVTGSMWTCRGEKKAKPTSYLPSFVLLLLFAFMYLPLPFPPFPFFALLARLPKTHSVLVGSVLVWKTSDSCCVSVLSLRCGLAPYVGPHLLAGEDYELQALIKTGFVYPPACAAASIAGHGERSESGEKRSEHMSKTLFSVILVWSR